MRIIKKICTATPSWSSSYFIEQNLETVQLTFLKWSVTTPLSFATAIIYILGAISGGLIFSILKKLTIEDSQKKGQS